MCLCGLTCRSFSNRCNLTPPLLVGSSFLTPHTHPAIRIPSQTSAGYVWSTRWSAELSNTLGNCGTAKCQGFSWKIELSVNFLRNSKEAKYHHWPCQDNLVGVSREKKIQESLTLSAEQYFQSASGAVLICSIGKSGAQPRSQYKFENSSRTMSAIS